MDVIEVRGKATRITSTLPWSQIQDKIKRLGGVPGPISKFPDAESLTKFEHWYGRHAPEGLLMRVALMDVIPDWVNGQPKTLKALRMWHWRQTLQNRAEERKFEKLLGETASDGKRLTFAHQMNMFRMQANLHLSAVQVLNDSLPGTAEQDCAEEDAREQG